MAIKRRPSIRVEPDLTPMLDLTFNLITFFIMVSNMSQDVYDQRVRLPVAGSAAPLAEAGTDRLVLNIDSEGRLLFNERTLSTEEAVKEIRFQADLARLNAKSVGQEIALGDPLPSTVILRADRDTTFREVFTIITACQAQGYLKFDMRGVTAAP